MQPRNRITWFVDLFERNSGLVVHAAGLFTLLLIIPLLLMAPDEQASADPSGEVFDLRDDLDDRFQSLIHGTSFLVESRSGDILTQAALWELYQNTQRLLRADERGELAPNGLPLQRYLYEAFDLDTNRLVVGVTTIADAVQQVLVNDPRFGVSLENATDGQVKSVISQLLLDPQTSGLADSLSINAKVTELNVNRETIGYWASPALVFNVLADNERLGGGTLNIGVGGGETDQGKEQFNRNVQQFLRGDEQNYRLWGIAIDANLEADDEGKIAGLFIMFTVIAAVIIVGISLRSYWAMALTGAGLGILMIWLKGISNLVGIKGGLIIELIVPIAMISLGVDFAVHAIRRYQEEKNEGFAPSQALRVGLVGVLGALTLAMFSDSIAFLSNVSSGIESIVHFGVAATIAVVSSYIVLGVVLPLVMMRIDQVKGPDRVFSSTPHKVVTIVGGVGAAVLFGTGIILMVAISQGLGLLVLVGSIEGFIVVPMLVMNHRNRGRKPDFEDSTGAIASAPRDESRGIRWIEGLVTRLPHFAPGLLIITLGVTASAVLLAVNLEPTFDVKDFFSNGSDFVVGLDKLDEHVGPRGGEPGIVYIEGDLTDTVALSAIQQFVDRLSNNPYVAKDASGEVGGRTRLPGLLKRLTGSEYAQVQLATGVLITDLNGDGFPDSSEQVKAAYDYMTENGIPLDESTLVFDPSQVKAVLLHDPDGEDRNVTTITLGIPGTREQSVVAAARLALLDDMKVLDESPAISRVGLTGSPFTREAQLEATTRTLQLSLPISAAGAFVLLLLVMRSIRYAVVTVIPIGLVVAWLYAFMYMAGFALNFVTATIGAISVGVGIDYSIHMTERFREELSRASDKAQALRQAARGTGVALTASAASSIVGFAIMGFAPMPLFASYGFLTAVMIFLALSASMVVLPTLLMIVTPEKAAASDEAEISPS